MTAPADSGAICENTDVSRSMIRPGLFASRSVTTHDVVAPVAGLRTKTVVPFGSVGLAHWPAAQWYQVARPVALESGRVVVVGAGITRTWGAGAVGTLTGAGAGAGAATGAGAAGAVVVVVVVGAGTRLLTSIMRRRCRSPRC